MSLSREFFFRKDIASKNEYITFGHQEGDQMLEKEKNYVIYEVKNNDGEKILVLNMHFPSDNTIEQVKKLLGPLIKKIGDYNESGDYAWFALGGDLNIQLTAGVASDIKDVEKHKKDIQEFIVEHLASCSLQAGQFYYSATTYEKHRSDNYLKNPQAWNKNEEKNGDSMVAVTGPMKLALAELSSFSIVQKLRTLNVELLSSASASEHENIARTLPFNVFKLPTKEGRHSEESAFDHGILRTQVGGMEIFFGNIMETTGVKGVNATHYKKTPPQSLQLQLTLGYNLAVGYVLSLKEEELYVSDVAFDKLITTLQDYVKDINKKLKDLPLDEKKATEYLLYHEASEKLKNTLKENKKINLPFSLKRAECLWAIADSLARIIELDLFLYDKHRVGFINKYHWKKSRADFLKKENEMKKMAKLTGKDNPITIKEVAKLYFQHVLSCQPIGGFNQASPELYAKVVDRLGVNATTLLIEYRQLNMIAKKLRLTEEQKKSLLKTEACALIDTLQKFDEKDPFMDDMKQLIDNTFSESKLNPVYPSVTIENLEALIFRLLKNSKDAVEKENRKEQIKNIILPQLNDFEEAVEKFKYVEPERHRNHAYVDSMLYFDQCLNEIFKGLSKHYEDEVANHQNSIRTFAVCCEGVKGIFNSTPDRLFLDYNEEKKETSKPSEMGLFSSFSSTKPTKRVELDDQKYASSSSISFRH